MEKEEKGIQWRQRERRNPMFSIALDPVLEEQVKEAAKEKGLCVSEYVCRLIQEKMEDEYDFCVYTKRQKGNTRLIRLRIRPKSLVCRQEKTEIGRAHV